MFDHKNVIPKILLAGWIILSVKLKCKKSLKLRSVCVKVIKCLKSPNQLVKVSILDRTGKLTKLTKGSRQQKRSSKLRTLAEPLWPPPLSNFGHLILKKLLLQESTLHPLKHVLNKTCFKQNLFFLSLLVTRIMIFVAMFQYLTAGKVAATPYTMPPPIWIYDFLMFISCFRWYRSI